VTGNGESKEWDFQGLLRYRVAKRQPIRDTANAACERLV
jgi:hypothetical protein